ncbi:crotonase/enoyl-CoA hydratase family protein [Polyangium spumosum]|uniref:Crotonase/enoyl-CoA hydratase family protein n=1 Tax=Polyangium spumosum TaxID=889282 RepID=A0A6N7PZ66_9BACT|nr:crotonase/enoyl-CoA hydratase family protein [Polyangium spumosum]MRG96166.1 crotonase/enoyl-CoA hydratase family protein [Polyangium spumosum]
MARVTVERLGRTVRIGLNRPEKRNAFDLAMLDELAQAYTAYEEDEGLRCGLLFAHGGHFTGGLDLVEVGPAVAAGRALYPPGSVDPLAIGARRLTKPMVVAVSGYCFTIGIELALAADIRVAAEDTRFSQLEVQRGIFPFGGATLRFPALAGHGNAMRWLLTGDVFDAKEAYRIGLVQEVVPASELLDRAAWLCERVAAQAPIAVRETLASCRAAMIEGPDVEAKRLEARARVLMKTEDAAEGMRSFVERRAGRFSGR